MPDRAPADPVVSPADTIRAAQVERDRKRIERLTEALEALADTPKRECMECLMAWFLYGDGAICLYHQERVFWKGRQ